LFNNISGTGIAAIGPGVEKKKVEAYKRTRLLKKGGLLPTGLDHQAGMLPALFDTSKKNRNHGTDLCAPTFL